MHGGAVDAAEDDDPEVCRCDDDFSDDGLAGPGMDVGIGDGVGEGFGNRSEYDGSEGRGDMSEHTGDISEVIREVVLPSFRGPVLIKSSPMPSPGAWPGKTILRSFWLKFLILRRWRLAAKGDGRRHSDINLLW